MVWKIPGHGLSDADVARFPRARFHFLALFVVDDRVDAGHARPGAARLHQVERGLGAAEESAVLRLPPRVDDDGFRLPTAL